MSLAVTVSRANGCHYRTVHHGDALTRESGDAALTEAVVSGTIEQLLDGMAALCRYAGKLTLQPAAMTERDLEPLRVAVLPLARSGNRRPTRSRGGPQWT
jgi:AhpD family alkylhydroperoxidase